MKQPASEGRSGHSSKQKQEAGRSEQASEWRPFLPGGGQSRVPRFLIIPTGQSAAGRSLLCTISIAGRFLLPVPSPLLLALYPLPSFVGFIHHVCSLCCQPYCQAPLAQALVDARG